MLGCRLPVRRAISRPGRTSALSALGAGPGGRSAAAAAEARVAGLVARPSGRRPDQPPAPRDRRCLLDQAPDAELSQTLLDVEAARQVEVPARSSRPTGRPARVEHQSPPGIGYSHAGRPSRATGWEAVGKCLPMWSPLGRGCDRATPVDKTASLTMAIESRGPAARARPHARAASGTAPAPRQENEGEGCDGGGGAPPFSEPHPPRRVLLEAAASNTATPRAPNVESPADRFKEAAESARLLGASHPTAHTPARTIPAKLTQDRYPGPCAPHTPTQGIQQRLGKWRSLSAGAR